MIKYCTYYDPRCLQAKSCNIILISTYYYLYSIIFLILCTLFYMKLSLDQASTYKILFCLRIHSKAINLTEYIPCLATFCDVSGSVSVARALANLRKFPAEVASCSLLHRPFLLF